MTSALPTGGVDAGQEAQLTNPDVNPMLHWVRVARAGGHHFG